VIFYSGASTDGPYDFGYEEGWHWSKNRGSYDRGRDFFWVHWEISDGSPHSVKLHVECPNAATDPELNAIKQEMVQAFLSPTFKNILEQQGYTYIIGRRIKPEHIERFKSTQAFRVMLTDEQSQNDNKANIEMVNAVTNDAVRKVIKRFSTQLNSQFKW
jgi:hypothetical protein